MTQIEAASHGQFDLYLPRPAQIDGVVPLTATESLFRIHLKDSARLAHHPGQFVEVSLLGVGEAPISVCSAQLPDSANFELCIRKLGSVTSKLHSLHAGDTIGIRGPFGHGFDLELLRGKDLLFIAGGIGLAPLRALIQHCLMHRSDFGRLTLLHGAKTPSELLFRGEFSAWSQALDFDLHLLGVRATLSGPLKLDPERTVAVVVGPPVLCRFAVEKLQAKGLSPEAIWLSLERKMRCGVGKCGHCTIGDYYCCIDGPVFLYSQIKDIPEAL